MVDLSDPVVCMMQSDCSTSAVRECHQDEFTAGTAISDSLVDDIQSNIDLVKMNIVPIFISSVIVLSEGSRPEYHHPRCVVDSLSDYTDLCYKSFSTVRSIYIYE